MPLLDQGAGTVPEMPALPSCQGRGGRPPPPQEKLASFPHWVSEGLDHIGKGQTICGAVGVNFSYEKSGQGRWVWTGGVLIDTCA